MNTDLTFVTKTWRPYPGRRPMNPGLNTYYYVTSDLHWDWDSYITQAEKQKENNYQKDPILSIKNISFKLRDLALSNFSPYYAAFDLHVTRVVTRIGWLN